MFGVVLLLSIWFGSLTPAHLYVHDLWESSKDHDHPDEANCDYYTFVTTGQVAGLALANADMALPNSELIVQRDNFRWFSETKISFTKANLYLRGPPNMG